MSDAIITGEEKIKDRKKRLREIQRTISLSVGGPSGPAGVTGLSTFLGIVIAIYYLIWQFNLPSPAIIIGFVLAYFISSRVYKTQPYKTWNDKLYDLLSDYDPANKEAYVALQTSARENGLDRDKLIDWIGLERAAIDPPIKNPLEEKFLNKRI